MSLDKINNFLNAYKQIGSGLSTVNYFSGLLDTPSGYESGYYLISTDSGIDYQSITGLADSLIDYGFNTGVAFTDLSDSPTNYQSGYFVKSTSSGIEYSERVVSKFDSLPTTVVEGKLIEVDCVLYMGCNGIWLDTSKINDPADEPPTAIPPTFDPPSDPSECSFGRSAALYPPQSIYNDALHHYSNYNFTTLISHRGSLSYYAFFNKSNQAWEYQGYWPVNHMITAPSFSADGKIVAYQNRTTNDSSFYVYQYKESTKTWAQLGSTINNAGWNARSSGYIDGPWEHSFAINLAGNRVTWIKESQYFINPKHYHNLWIRSAIWNGSDWEMLPDLQVYKDAVGSQAIEPRYSPTQAPTDPIMRVQWSENADVVLYFNRQGAYANKWRVATLSSGGNGNTWTFETLDPSWINGDLSLSKNGKHIAVYYDDNYLNVFVRFISKINGVWTYRSERNFAHPYNAETRELIRFGEKFVFMSDDGNNFAVSNAFVYGQYDIPGQTHVRWSDILYFWDESLFPNPGWTQVARGDHLEYPSKTTSDGRKRVRQFAPGEHIGCYTSNLSRFTRGNTHFTLDGSCTQEYLGTETEFSNEDIRVAFLDLTDTPEDYTLAGNKMLRVNNSQNGIEFIDSKSLVEETSYTAFTGLNDTPYQYQSGSLLQSKEDSIEYISKYDLASELSTVFTEEKFIQVIINSTFQTQYLLTDAISDTIIPDFHFTNLNVGSQYRLSSTLSFITQGDTEQYVQADFYNGVHKKLVSLYNQGKSTSASTSFVFTCEHDELFVSGKDLTNIDYIGGSPGHISFVQLEAINANTDVVKTTPSVTPTNTPTPSVTPTITVTSSNTPSTTATPTVTFSTAPTSTPSNTPTQTPTNTPTPTVTPSVTTSNSVTPTNTATPTITPTNTPSNTSTPTNTPTQTPTPTHKDTDKDGIPDIDDPTPLPDPIPLPPIDDPTIDLGSYSTMSNFPTFYNAGKNIEQSDAGLGSYSRFSITDFKNKNYISHLDREGINCYIGQSSHHGDCTYTWYKGPGSDSDNIFLAPPANPSDNSRFYSSYQCYYRDWRYYVQEDYKYFPSYSTFDQNEVITNWQKDHGWSKVIGGSSTGFVYNLNFYRWNHSMHTVFDRVYMQDMSLLNIELDEIYDLKKMEIILTQDNPYCIFRYKVRQGGRTNTKGWYYRNHSHKIIFELKEGEAIKRLRFLPENRLDFCGVQEEDPDGWINIRMPKMHGLLCDDYPTIDLVFGNEDNLLSHIYYSAYFSRIKFFELYSLYGWTKNIVIDETSITLEYDPANKELTFDKGGPIARILKVQDKTTVTLDSGIELELYFYRLKNQGGSAILGIKTLSPIYELNNGDTQAINVYQLSTEQYVQIIGQNVEATLTIDTQSFTVKEDSGSLIWDYGGVGEQSINVNGGTITITLASGRELTLTFYKTGSLFFSLLKTYDPVTPTPTPSLTVTPTATSTPTVTPTLINYNCLEAENTVSIENGKYIFNNIDSKHYMNSGTFNFIDIPFEHPIAFHDNIFEPITGDNGNIFYTSGDFSYSGEFLFGSKNSMYDTIHRHKVHHFYYGDVQLNIGENFAGLLSYECYNHGYMGGEDNLEFNPIECDAVHPSPTLTPSATLTPSPTLTPSNTTTPTVTLTPSTGTSLFNPGFLGSDLQAWYDASDTSTITTSNGGNDVTQMNDKSSNGFNLTVINSNKIGPNSGIRTLNGLNVIDYDKASTGGASTQILEVDNFNKTQPILVSMLVQIDDEGIASEQDFFISFTETTNPRIGLRRTTADGFQVLTSGGTFGSGAIMTEPGTYLITVYFNSNNSSIRINGSLIKTGSIGNLTLQNINLGGNCYEDQSLDGSIAETVLYSNNSNIMEVEGYLAHKWGQQDLLPSNHHYKNNPPLVAPPLPSPTPSQTPTPSVTPTITPSANNQNNNFPYNLPFNLE